MSFLLGAIFMLFNLWSISKTWGLVLKKKSIALAGLIIVLKYPLLFFVLKLILEKKWVSPIFFIFGLVAFSFVGLLIRKIDKEKKH